MSEDIYDNEERQSLDEHEDYMECFDCGYYGNDYMILKEFGMEFAICPACGRELV